MAGAPLRVLAVTVPHAGEQAAPFWVNVQATPALVTSFITVAVNCGVVPTTTVVGVGATRETEITGTVMVAELIFKGSSTDVAISVTVGDTVAIAGPVYVMGVPLGEFAALSVPHAGEHGTPFWDRLQLTPCIVPSFVTVAVNGCIPLKVAKVAEGGVTVTEMGRRVMGARLNAAPFVTDMASRNIPRNPKAGWKCAGAV